MAFALLPRFALFPALFTVFALFALFPIHSNAHAPTTNALMLPIAAASLSRSTPNFQHCWIGSETVQMPGLGFRV